VTWSPYHNLVINSIYWLSHDQHNGIGRNCVCYVVYHGSVFGYIKIGNDWVSTLRPVILDISQLLPRGSGEVLAETEVIEFIYQHLHNCSSTCQHAYRWTCCQNKLLLPLAQHCTIIIESRKKFRKRVSNCI